MTAVMPTVALEADLLLARLSGDRQTAGNVTVILEDRGQLLGALMPILENLAGLVARPPRRVCVTCRCLLLPRDRRCPGCDAKAGCHFDRKVG